MQATRPGITLVEMLVALAVTLIMMGAVITVFGFIGERVTDSRSMIETNDRLRSAAHRLREDLSSITVDVVPWQRPEAGQGYLEILEGPERDFRRDPANGNFTSPNSIFGDWDDVLFTTIRTKGDPYRGKLGATSIESNTAEVVWYLRDSNPGVVTNPPLYTLCRRLLLIVPQATLDDAIATLPATDRPRMSREWFYNYFDISARVESPSGPRIANTLGDLTKRENRFGHNRWDANGNLAFPFFVRLNQADPSASNIRVYPHVREDYRDRGREGEEVVLTNVLSFNIQVYDTTAPLRQNAGVVVAPGEPGYRTGTGGNLPLGAYIDLGEDMPGVTFNFKRLDPNSPIGRRCLLAPTVAFPYSTYDTWSFHYEHDGIRQPTHLVDYMPRDWRQGDGPPDPGTNGIDDNDSTKMAGGAAFPGVDDITERETYPPYPYPLRGLRATIRVYEPTSKQVREVTVVESFVPE
jgi:hypothetical protein